MIFGLFGGNKKRVAEMISAARAGDMGKIQQLISTGADIDAQEPESGDTPLIAAIDKSQWAAAELLLRHHPNLSLEDKNGNSPLYMSVSRGDSALGMVKLLLEAGASPDLGPSQGENAGATPLHIACALGANACLEALLRHGASATKQLHSGASPMHTAALGGDQKTVELLSKAGGDVNALSNEKKAPLHNCGITGNTKVAGALIQLGAVVDPVDAEGCTPLMRAVMKNHTEAATLFLDNGADPDVIVRTDGTPLSPLFVAAMDGLDEMIRILIDKGANVAAKVEGLASPVDVAKHKGHEVAAKLLLAALKLKKATKKESDAFKKDVDVVWKKITQAIAQKDNENLDQLTSSKHYSALSADSRLLVACVLGDVEQVQLMLQAGADPNKSFADVLDGITPLYATVGLARSVDVARLLLDGGANANHPWSQGSTPIFEVTSDHYLDLAKLLLSREANVNARLANGMTPLTQAARNGGAECVDLFLDAGADINAVETEHGIGAFGCALNRLDLKLAEHLFNRGAEPNFGSIETLPLAIAEHGSLAFVRSLKERGCDLIREGQRGRMAFISAKNPDPEVFDYLLNHGADPSEGNNFGYTPLILAALNNRPTLIRRYLERGDDAIVRDIDGETALSLALENRHYEAIAALREFHVEEKDYSALAPSTGMLKAAEDGALGTILTLREEGIPINSEDEDGNSPMMLAVKAGHLGVVRSLYHLGADINHINHAGETALGIAKSMDITDIQNSLQEFGALDAMNGELGKLSNMFGGIAVFNAADTMFGRMSHPYKENPPYDNPATDSEDESNVAVADEGYEHSGDDMDDAKDAHASIAEKIESFSQAVHSDEIKALVSNEVLEQLQQKVEELHSMHESEGLGDDEIVELNKLLELFGLYKSEVSETVRTPLLEAVHEQDLAAVKKLVKDGADINEADTDGNTALIVAILSGDEKLVDGLLKLGADPNNARHDGVGPLFASVLTGKDKISQVLIKGGAEVEAHSSIKHNGIAVRGCTALYGAAFAGQLAVCKVLFGNGAQIDAANDIGYTPLMAAIEGDHEEVIDFLLKSGANADPDVFARMQVEGLGGVSPLYIATRKENLAVIKKLLKRGVDVNRPSVNLWTPLKSAAQQGNLDLVKVLLDAGADPNIADKTNYTPLMNAVSGEHEAIVKLLLKFHADPNVQSGENLKDDDWEPGRTALMDGAVSGNVSIARELLKQGANPNLLNSKGRTALHSAVLSANTSMVSLVLNAGADPNVCGNDEERLSALGMALCRWASEDEDGRVGGVSDVLELMLKQGMPTDGRALNEVALNLAIEGHSDAIPFLQERGVTVDPNQLMSNGASYLFILAGTGDDGLDSAALLLSIGADPNYKSPVGLSVLSLAVRSGATKLAQALLAAGSDVMARNSAGVLAYDLAVIYGHDELADVLMAQMNHVAPEVDKQGSDGNTALMKAVKDSDTEATNDLLAKGADASRRDLHGDSPLSYALCRDRHELVRLLREAGAERLFGDASNGGALIVTAGSQGALGTILDLLDSGVPIDATDATGDTALTAAAFHPGIVKALAKRGADLAFRNKDGNTAYMIAAASSRLLMMHVLEEVGSPIDEPVELDGLAQMQVILNTLRSTGSADDSGAVDTESDVDSDADQLLVASLTGNAFAVSRQIAAGVDVNYENDDGRTALILALSGLGRGGMSRRRERDFEQVIATLLIAGADPNIGLFPTLIIATATGRLHLVNALIRAGAEVNVTADLPKGDHTETMLANALFVALSPNEHDSRVDERVGLALIRAGIDLSFSSYDGAMAVHYAAKSGMAKILRKILDLAPEAINAQDSEGSTPLMLASASNRFDVIKVLLERQANLEIRNAKGCTAAEIAMAAGHQQAAVGLT